MNYKEVFQLAQEKGYKLYTLKIEVFERHIIQLGHELTKQDILIELTLIQKWLRDEHKIHVSVFGSIRYNNWNYGIETAKPSYTRGSVTAPQRTYEQALLEGIHEALNLLP